MSKTIETSQLFVSTDIESINTSLQTITAQRQARE